MPVDIHEGDPSGNAMYAYVMTMSVTMYVLTRDMNCQLAIQDMQLCNRLLRHDASDESHKYAQESFRHNPPDPNE